ncbi:MAG: lipoyl domain-containing protein [Actinobacteria bacterium]|nr:lipoyl domain-containing protein [Actinomycetota bacterium]
MSAQTLAVHAPTEVWEDADEDVEGLLDEWHVAVGDAVEAGQAIASLMIVKTSFDLEAPVTGTVAEILVAKGETFGRESELVRIEPGA